ncbi:MAG: hypothetical protein K2H33_04545 [Muribaculaceae bacterium]|uniref:hypothetical protein n=1 Tax=uncultured Muribaculum sp. TaxID=1918613 RepID=UPI0023C31336|nr:hypothetical protein [uncultured Muribaculum sp.]MDE5900608.1 hypothetical protein [Muribaculaceae bacterium]
MKARKGIKKYDVYAIARKCLIADSDIVDIDKLIDRLKKAQPMKIGVPNGLDDIIVRGEKAVQAGIKRVRNLDELASTLGVTRKTLNSWVKLYNIPELSNFSNGGGNAYAAQSGRYDLVGFITELKALAKSTQFYQ